MRPCLNVKAKQGDFLSITMQSTPVLLVRNAFVDSVASVEQLMLESVAPGNPLHPRDECNGNGYAYRGYCGKNFRGHDGPNV